MPEIKLKPMYFCFSYSYILLNTSLFSRCSKHLISDIAQSSRQISDIKMNNVYNKNYKFSIEFLTIMARLMKNRVVQIC